MTFSFLYRPREWPTLASNLAAALVGNGVPIVNYALDKIELNTTIPAKTTSAIYAVTCVDTPDFEGVDRQKAIDDVVDEMAIAQRLTSRHFSALEIDVCHHWSAREVERFTGPFNHTLSNEILVIGNTADVRHYLIIIFNKLAKSLHQANYTRPERESSERDDAPFVSSDSARRKRGK